MSSTHNKNKAITDVEIFAGDGASTDAFGRWRVSLPYTVFDSKQLYDNQPLLWDESLESGAGISSSHSVNSASTTITSTASTAGLFTRQTFMRFNYRPGKSNNILMTGVMRKTYGGSGTIKRIGLFDDNNGIFFEDNNNIMHVVVRSFESGAVVDNAVPQSNWNIDTLDGNGPSGVIVDWSKIQIFSFDFEWLGAGRVRMSIDVDGRIVYVHKFLHANVIDSVYMSTPNLPLRYQLSTTANSPATSMEAICSSVMSEGGDDRHGALHYVSTGGTHVDANDANSLYAIIGIRLKSAYVGTTVNISSVSVVNQAGDDYEWVIVLNPTVAGSITFADVNNSAAQTVTGVTANTVTGGTQLFGGVVKSGANAGAITETDIYNSITLGQAIDGTLDTMFLCVRPFTNGANIEASLGWREVA